MCHNLKNYMEINPQAFESQVPKEVYRAILEANRHILTDDQMNIFLTLYEEDNKEEAAAVLGMSVAELENITEPFMPKRFRKKKERLSREGKPYLKRLSRAAFVAILEDHSQLDEQEQEIVSAMAKAPNQVVAAQSLGMKYSDFIKLYLKMRRKHGF